jgi:hypothetical protein
MNNQDQPRRPIRGQWALSGHDDPNVTLFVDTDGAESPADLVGRTTGPFRWHELATPEMFAGCTWPITPDAGVGAQLGQLRAEIYWIDDRWKLGVMLGGEPILVDDHRGRIGRAARMAALAAMEHMEQSARS